MYANLCMARLLGEHGRTHEALAHWMRAGLHWVSAQVPEALAPRVCGSILHRRVLPGERVVEAISAALLRDIRAAAEAARQPRAQDLPADPLVFRKREHVGHAGWKRATLLGADGWVVLASPVPTQVIYEGEMHRALRTFLTQIISAPALFETAGIRSIFLDDGFGRGVAETLAQTIALALRLGLDAIVFEGRTIDLADAQRSRLTWALQARIGPAVSNIRDAHTEHASVSFKRYLSPRLLSGFEKELLRRVTQPVRLDRLADDLGYQPGDPEFMAQVRDLEADRIIVLDLDEQTVSAELLVV